MYKLQKQVSSSINIDCIKVCPFNNQYFAFAYYQQHPEFIGGISVHSITKPECIIQLPITITEPILHITWNLSHENKYLLAAACREKIVLFFEFEPQQSSLILLKQIDIANGVFCLYLDFQTISQGYQVIVSTNEQTVWLINLDNNLEIASKIKHSNHKYAVWACRFNPFRKSQYVTGDEENSVYLYQNEKLILKNSKAHKQGICDLVFIDQYSFYSGGFDGFICQYDTRKFSQCLNQHNFGGTIWRIVPNQAQKIILLCNSSEKKFQIIENNLSQQIWNSEATHESLAYAADWNKQYLLTASFYDKKLCCWQK